MEVSLVLDQLLDSKLRSPDIRWTWHEKVTKFLKLLIGKVLCDQEIVRQVYKPVSMMDQLWHLGNVSYNCLAIGEQSSWLILAKTCHRGHFLGTERRINLKAPGQKQFKMSRIKELILRFATPGAVIDVFVLHPKATYQVPDAVVMKDKAAQYQPPGCSMADKNGISTPFSVKVPLEQGDLDAQVLSYWGEAQRSIADAMQQMNAQPAPVEQAGTSRLTRKRVKALLAHSSSAN